MEHSENIEQPAEAVAPENVGTPELPRKRSFWRKLFGFFGWIIALSLILMAIGGGVTAGILYSFYTELPNIDRIENFQPSLVTTVYDRNNEVIGEFFIEKRELVTYDQLPKDFIHALLAVEDKRFFEHFGIDMMGIGRAILTNIQNRTFSEGASTITQQLTRLLFLSPEKKLTRKVKEWMLAIEIEKKYRDLEKDQQKAKRKILELYANQYYLGHGAYGVQSAASVYFGKDVGELDLGECAMLAGILQRPSAYSPILYPDRAKKRQRHVLERMVVEGYITPQAAKAAYDKPFEKKQVPERQINEAPYFVEYVRQYLEERYAGAFYQDGLQVYTTVDLHLQDVAMKSLQEGLRTVQKRHGFVLVDRDKTPEEIVERKKVIEQQEWKNPPQKGDVVHAFVTEVSSDQIVVRLKDYSGTIAKKGFAWAAKDATKIVRADDIILVNVHDIDDTAHTLQLTLNMEPALEGALLTIDPKTGYILAMVGGYDFYRSKFNRAVQALRQPGSSFKPFVYLTSLERGLTLSDIIVDEPTTFVVDGRTKWTPKNFSGNFSGPMTLRHALETSTNVVTAKLIDQLTPRAVIDTARRLGITGYLNPYPSLALGGSEVYLKELVSAYCAFANRGYRVEPIAVTKVLDHDGKVLEENSPRAQQVIAEDIDYLLVSMLEGVVQRGTAGEAKSLGRPLAGKTGTTNDNTDALFVGFSPSLVAGVWVGYDENRKSIGAKETGGKAALPIWIDFMEKALKDTPIEDFPVPAGISFVQIEPRTGLLASPQCGGDVFTEAFKKGTEPREYCYQSRN